MCIRDRAETMETLKQGLFTYPSVRYLQVEAKCPALLFRTLQLVVVVYIVVYSIVLQKAYQEYQPVVAETFSKVKGSAVNSNQSVYDTIDLVVPPLLENSIFITTNFVRVNETKDSLCPLVNVSGYSCAGPGDCPTNEMVYATNDGYTTGNCSKAGAGGWCIVRGWCANVDPSTNMGTLPDFLGDTPELSGDVVDGVQDWSLFVRINYAFPKFGVTLSTASTQLDPGREVEPSLVVGLRISTVGLSLIHI
eukprot:TRINITY_DN15056_c0_g1_i1.p2 TRINITY_DN15056_c0_g1~~TRINITY_DN15056_c0_g1_i1.p2  ORF type:complete len:250 (-),score=72.10 TRINITY_DN15056_c0_g1_i1:4-753(-)